MPGHSAAKRSWNETHTSVETSPEAFVASRTAILSPDSQQGSQPTHAPDSKRARVGSSSPGPTLCSSADIYGNLLDVPESPLSSAASDLSDWPEAIEEKRVVLLDTRPRKIPVPIRAPKGKKEIPIKKSLSQTTKLKASKEKKPKALKNVPPRTPISKLPKEPLTPTSTLRRSGRASAIAATSVITDLYIQNQVEYGGAERLPTPDETSRHPSRTSYAILPPKPSVLSRVEDSVIKGLVTPHTEVPPTPNQATAAFLAISCSPSSSSFSSAKSSPNIVDSHTSESEITEVHQSPQTFVNTLFQDAEKEMILWDIAKQISDARLCGSGPKPKPSGQPRVWADGRQALCETLPYYRAYQSGGYCTDGLARAFMFDSNSHPRDHMDQNVVISRAGGGKSKNETSGEMELNGDQPQTTQVSDVLNNIEQSNPIVIIVGAKNPTCPSQPPHTYCVMDWFKPTHVWYEKTNGNKFIRYRFEKLRPYENCWWVPPTWSEPVGLGDLEPPISKCCTTCNEDSLQVYINSWMCLTPMCPDFWKLTDGSEPKEEDLLYDPRFLTAHTPWRHCSEPSPIRPELLTVSSLPIQGQNTSFEAWKGFACPKCGRCNSREAWEGWECGGVGCSFTHQLDHTLVPAVSLRDPYFPLGTGYAFSRDLLPNKELKLKVRTEYVHNYRINYFDIPGIDGFVAHLIANKTINEEPNGPNDMFEDLQLNSIGLRRSPLPSGMLKGPSLTQHFLVNYGMPYKFVVAAQSHPFETAARAIKDTRSRLNWAGRLAVPNMAHDFNEVLALGYFEDQSISYHDDGEKGLGPTIATLSLGCTAKMKLRMKANHYHGITKGRNYFPSKPIPGCEKYEARKAAYDALMALKATDMAAYKAKIQTLPKELGLTTAKKAKDTLELKLGHGDIVIMHGKRIQEYYEHKVEPMGKLRFALTCRYIDPKSLKPADRPAYEVSPDDQTYDGSKLPAAM